MSNGMNKALVVGTVVRDPETKATQSGTTVCNLTVVTNYKSKGEEHPEFHRVVLFGRVAEIADQYVRKGGLVGIEGRIQTRKWTDKDGNDRYSTEIVAHDMQMLSGGSRKDSGNNASTGHTEAPGGNVAPAGGGFDEIPFAPLDWRV